jgi:hypothetical protein
MSSSTSTHTFLQTLFFAKRRNMSLSQLLAQTFPGKPTWTVENIPDLTGKVTIVTGTFLLSIICPMSY